MIMLIAILGGGAIAIAIGWDRVVRERADIGLLRARQEWLKNLLEITQGVSALANAHTFDGAEVMVRPDENEQPVLSYREPGSAATRSLPLAQIRVILKAVESRIELKEIRLRGGWFQIAFGATLGAMPFFANPYLALLPGAAIYALFCRLPIRASKSPLYEIRRFNEAVPGDSLIGGSYYRWRSKQRNPWQS